MEAVGVASAFAGLASLGITVCNGLLQYYDAWKHAEDNMTSMYKSVETLTKTFLVLRRSIGPPHGRLLFHSGIVSTGLKHTYGERSILLRKAPLSD